MIKHWHILVLFTLLWFGALFFTGTLTSGFHLTDDHDLISLKKDLATTTVSREVNGFLSELFGSKLRFRPFYAVSRRAVGAVLGTDFFAWSVYTGILAVLTSFFLFLFTRTIGFSLLESLFFVGFTLIGEQAAIWWKLGANETPGMVMLALTLLVMAQSARLQAHPQMSSRAKRILFEILFIFFAILTSWCKESFVLILPALVFWKIELTYAYSEIPTLTRWQAVRKNTVTGMILLSVCAWELIHIYRAVTMTKIRYSGESGFNVEKLMKTSAHAVKATGGWVIVILLVVVGIIAFRTKIKDKKEKKDKMVRLGFALILAGLITGPQVLLYTRSGIDERYLLPAALGISFFTITLMKFIREHRVNAKKIYAVLLVVLLAAVLLNQLRITRYTAIGFAREGLHTQAWLQSIDQHTAANDLLLVISDPIKDMENASSLRTYMDSEMKRPHLFFCPPNLDTVHDTNRRFWKDLNGELDSGFASFSPLNPEERNRVSAILIFPKLERKFLKSSASYFNLNQFQRYTNDFGFVGYYKNYKNNIYK
ncbi:MAG: hypothetical protein ACM3SY_02070 [Candidatus Omnitrophota bacterium]